MTSLKTAFAALTLAATLAAPSIAEKADTSPLQQAGPIADESGAETMEARSPRERVIPIDLGPARTDRVESLADGFFMALGGLTWEGLAAQARWAEAYIAGEVGLYDRARYDDCLKFLEFYYGLLARTALIDVELEVYLRDIGVFAASTDDPAEGTLDRPESEIEAPDVSIPNGEA